MIKTNEDGFTDMTVYTDDYQKLYDILWNLKRFLMQEEKEFLNKMFEFNL